LSPVEIVQAVFARIDEVNSKTNAFCTLTEEQGLLAAKDAEASVMRREP
jgi:Asp-tRNA(Asn)/Glu-tRNA(Gln) amidotransferase A subunit family amidase